ncbi:MAG: branched-chain amino acid ABC transporter permease [Lysobacteraceae bacterium]|nr:MAG: branched-chain amino acid ABC transporter permease [Xanthomonadaceae bacterium]
MDLTMLVQGLTVGSIYALAAVSINIVYRATNTFNLAQGGLVMLGAIICSTFLVKLGFPWYAAAAVALVVVALISWLTDLIAVAPVLRRPGGGGHGWIVSTLAVSMIIDDLVGKLVGPDPVPVRAAPPFSTRALFPPEMQFSSYQLALIVFTLLLVGGTDLFYRTRTGKAILAISEDREASLLRAIDPRRLAATSFLLSGVVAAIAGVLAGPILFASIALGAAMLIKGFMAAALGGIGFNRGAIVGGYVLGLVEVVTATYLSPGYQHAVSFVVVLMVLLVRPQGLFGRASMRAV